MPATQEYVPDGMGQFGDAVSASPFRWWTFRRSPFRRQIGHKTWYFWWERFLCTSSTNFVFNFRV